MSRLPRILPLIAIAVVGVLALNAVSGARGLPDLIAYAKAFAEDVAPAKADPKAKAPDPKAADPKAADAKAGPLPADGPTQTAVGPAAAPVCTADAAELARGLGVSSAELAVFQSLSTRREQIDQLQGDADLRLNLIDAAVKKFDERIKALKAAEESYRTVLAERDVKQQEEVARQVRIYEAMKPKDAAAAMAILPDAVRLPIAAKMKERSLAAVMGQMPPRDRALLTERLQARYAEALPAVPVATPAAKATPTPAQTAAAPAKKTG